MEWMNKMSAPNRKRNMEKQDREEKGRDSEADKDSRHADKDWQILYEDFLAIIRDLTDTAHKIAQVEEEKAIAVSLKRHELLEGFMKREQAGILKLRGLDQHRVRLARQLGWDALSFPQILGKVSPDQQECLKMMFFELEQELKRLIKSKELAGQMINIRIYQMIVAIERKAGVPYDQARKVNLDEFSHTSLCDRYA